MTRALKTTSRGFISEATWIYGTHAGTFGLADMRNVRGVQEMEDLKLPIDLG